MTSKLIMVGPPAWIDLVHWLKLRRYAKTSGDARELLKSGRVRSGANSIGRRTVKVQRGTMESVEYVADPLVSADLRGTIYVSGIDSVR